jgi:3-oxoacyl-(acyl-carrier-protein) synthase
MGVITPVGHDLDTLWSNLLAGRGGVGPVTRFDASGFPSRIAAEVRAFSAIRRTTTHRIESCGPPPTTLHADLERGSRNPSFNSLSDQLIAARTLRVSQ